jgi:DNA-binding NtrC family response regulator
MSLPRREDPGCSHIQDAMIGRTPVMHELQTLIRTVAQRDCAVLISGESGTGKELVARRIHRRSGRSQKPFVPVDCTTLLESLFASQMFGHRRGSFTGASCDTVGFVRSAEGGTLFLDEVGELEPANQARLLRFLQERVVVPVGEVRPIPVDVRVVAATHRDLLKMVERGEFRLDLYYRLNVVQLDVPALRHRREDIAVLAQHFLMCLAQTYDESPRSIEADALAVLEAANWRGNVRELANAIEHAFVVGSGPSIQRDDLPRYLLEGADAGIPASADRCPPSHVRSFDKAERVTVAHALEVTSGHQSQAANLLQIERRRLYRLVKRHGLDHLTKRR